MSVFHQLFMKDDLSKLLLHSLGELRMGPSWMTRRKRTVDNHFRISIQMLSNGSDFFDVTLVWSGYKDGGAIKPKPAGREEERGQS